MRQLNRDSVELANVIRRKREEKNWTQAQLAEKAGISLRTVSAYEACDGNPGMASLFPIARVLGISLDDLCWAENYTAESSSLRDLMNMAASCTPDESEMLLAICKAALGVMRRDDQGPATKANKKLIAVK